MTDANYPEMFAHTKQMVDAGKRLTKYDMAYQIHHIEHWNGVYLFLDGYKRDEVVEEFNRIFGTNIK